MLRISWTAKETNISTLEELNIEPKLSSVVEKIILTLFGHAMRWKTSKSLLCRNRWREPEATVDHSPDTGINSSGNRKTIGRCIRTAVNREERKQ